MDDTVRALFAQQVPQEFSIANLERIEGGGKLVARFDVCFQSHVIHCCQFIVGRRGSFVCGPGQRTKFAPGGWENHCSFEPDLLEAIYSIVEARLAADEIDEAS